MYACLDPCFCTGAGRRLGRKHHAMQSSPPHSTTASKVTAQQTPAHLWLTPDNTHTRQPGGDTTQCFIVHQHLGHKLSLPVVANLWRQAACQTCGPRVLLTAAGLHPSTPRSPLAPQLLTCSTSRSLT